MDPLAHASIALITKPQTPEVPLWSLILATETSDILFFAFEALGIEKQAVTEVDFMHGTTYLSPAHLTFSHGFLMCLFWSFLAALFSRLFFKKLKINLLFGLMVFSHWLLDALVYSNLPLALDGSPEIGLGLINSGPGMWIGMAIEVLLIASGLVVYIKFLKKQKIIKNETSLS